MADRFEDMPLQQPSGGETSVEDMFLKVLVHIVNQENSAIDVTLKVGSLLMSGTMVSAKRYFEAIRDEFSTYLSARHLLGGEREEAARSTDEMYAAVFSLFSELQAERHEINPYEGIRHTSHLYLAEVAFYFPGQPVSAVRGGWWRERIAQVDGFMLGRIHRVEEPSSQPPMWPGVRPAQ